MRGFIRECISSKRFWVVMLLVVIAGLSCMKTLDDLGNNEWVGFWGNVVGGIFGTLGAYGAATYIFNLEEAKRRKPLLEKKKMEVITSFLNILQQTISYIFDFQDGVVEKKSYNDFLNNYTSLYMMPLIRLLPESYEAGPEIYKILHKSKEEIRILLRDHLHNTEFPADSKLRDESSYRVTCEAGEIILEKLLKYRDEMYLIVDKTNQELLDTNNH